MDNEKDLFIIQKLKEDKLISKKADDLFNNFNKGEFFMEEKFEKIEPTKDNVVNNVKKTAKWKKILATAASLVIVTGAANVYASNNGYGNVFFLIKYLVTGDKSIVQGKDEILSDRDITISYETIKLTENIRMQIRNFRVTENEAKLILVVNEEKLENDSNLVPLKYKVYNTSNKLLCDQKSIKEINSNMGEYTEELKLNDYKQEDNVLVLEVYKANNEKLAKITINLDTREITVDGEQEALKKISEIELKKYLGFISAYEETPKSSDDGKIHFAEAILSDIKNIEPYNTNNGIAYKVSDVNGTLESMGYEKVSDTFKKGDLFQRRTISSTEYFDVKSPTGGFNPNTVIEITDISYCAGLYTAEFSYAYIIEADSFSTDYSKVDKNTATVYFKVNEDDKYSKFKVVKFDKELSSAQDNTTTVQEDNTLTGKWVYTAATLRGKEVEFREVFGSGIKYGTGNIEFNKNGTFTCNMPGVSSSEFSNNGTYTVNGAVITLKYSDNRTEKLAYIEKQGRIEQNYGEYLLILKRPENVKEESTNTNTNTTTQTNTVSTNNTIQTNTTTSNEKIDNYASTMSWTEYWAPGIKFQYPTAFNLEEEGGYNRGNRQGEVSTRINGRAIGINPDTKEKVVSSLIIYVYEPIITKEDVSKYERDSNGISFTNKLGIQWYETKEEGKELPYVERYVHCEPLSDGYTAVYKIEFHTDNRNNWKITNIENWFLGTTKLTSY